MNILVRLRTTITPGARAYLHGVTPVLMATLVAYGLIAETSAGLVAAGVLAFVDLTVALLHSTAAWRSALYTCAAALQPVGIAIGLGTDLQWAATLALLPALLGSGIAAAKTPNPALGTER